MSTDIPREIILKKQSNCLVIRFESGEDYEYSFEYLRVYSPSADVKGHGIDDEVLQIGKEDVVIDALEAAGNYAIRVIFNDGHNTGLYTWDYLKELGMYKEHYWNRYLHKLAEAGYTRKEKD